MNEKEVDPSVIRNTYSISYKAPYETRHSVPCSSYKSSRAAYIFVH